MPGCLGIDALQQLAGFVLPWMGARGDGMAMGVDGVKFRGKVTPDSGTLHIGVDVKQARLSPKISTIKASGWLRADGKDIYTIDEIVVGVASRQKS